MIDPFSTWSRIVAAGLDMQQTWLRAAETMHASADVISARTGKMRDAGASPMHADLAEFARMVPEKLDAFSRSGIAMMQEMYAMQSAGLTQAHRMGMMATGGMRTMGEWGAFAARSSEYMLGAMDAGARAGRVGLAPIHKTATGNARRLRRGAKAAAGR